MKRVIKKLNPGDERPEFSCADSDLDEFYRCDSIKGSQELLSVTYVVMQDDRVVAYFSVLNDTIRKQDTTKPFYKRLARGIPFSKRYSTLPAAKIGRLGVCCKTKSKGVGTEVLDFLKAWFSTGNKTGCRFLTVDAYNQPQVTRFYEKNQFVYLTDKDAQDETRTMYFDLIRFKNREAEQQALK